MRTLLALMTAFMLHGGDSLTATDAAAIEAMLTVAEKSDYAATARYEEVVAFIDRLAAHSSVVRRGVLGVSVEGRELPLVILANPPVASAAEARAGRGHSACLKPQGGGGGDDRLVAFAFGNIHAGEVCGKEALLMLAREIAARPDHPLLEDLIIVIAPIFNADGNERVSKDNRPGQDGPREGMGVRHNAQGLDLNRDFVKLESPEVRAQVRFLNEWDPAIIIDTHTTNGSYHRYTITYDGPRNPAGDAGVIDFVRRKMLPEVSRRLERRTGYKSFFYGNFDDDRSVWETYPCVPRFGTIYRGLRNRIEVLSEAYSYAPYKDRVLATREFVRECLEHVAENRREVRRLLAEADRRTIAAGQAAGEGQPVGIRFDAGVFDEPVTIDGFVEKKDEGGRWRPTKEPKAYRVKHAENHRATKSVPRPCAYLVPAECAAAIENLRLHGIELHRLAAAATADVEVYRVDAIVRSPREFQGHREATVAATRRRERREIPAGMAVVKTAQPLGTLAVYLLEPESEDGLTTWNFFDAGLAEGRDHPVMRVGDCAGLEELKLERPGA